MGLVKGKLGSPGLYGAEQCGHDTHWLLWRLLVSAVSPAVVGKGMKDTGRDNKG